MDENLQNWSPRPWPERRVFEGRFAKLEPLDADLHADQLFAASTVAHADEKFTWLPDLPPTDPVTFRNWVDAATANDDPVFYAVIDKHSSKVAGRQTLMRIDTANGVIEIGNIYWGPLIAQKPAATEALYLFAKYIFDDLGYRRFEWKCNNDNAPSKRAALRFGFQHEGVFRQHMIVKGLNRDTAWFAMTDKDWPALKSAFQAWLDPGNFDASGAQIRRLQAFQGDGSN